MISMREKVLIVEDEPEIVQVISASLEKAGFEPIAAGDGPQALQRLIEHDLKLIVLDLNLPGMDGMEVARRIRKTSDAPIIMLTARVTNQDKLQGLRWADDYVTKPFNLQELLARIQSVLRRSRGIAPRPLIEAGELFVNLEINEVRVRGAPVNLTRTEFALLAAMVQQPQRIFNRWQLYAYIEQIRGHEGEGDPRAIDSHIKNLRRKIEIDPGNPRYIVTVYGMGYRFERACG